MGFDAFVVEQSGGGSGEGGFSGAAGANQREIDPVFSGGDCIDNLENFSFSADKPRDGEFGFR